MKQTFFSPNLDVFLGTHLPSPYENKQNTSVALPHWNPVFRFLFRYPINFQNIMNPHLRIIFQQQKQFRPKALTCSIPLKL